MTVSKIRSISRGFSFPTWSIPIALLVITVLSYGLRTFTLGFYWDDWPYLWFFHRLGSAGILSAFTQDRPFLSFIYTLTLSTLGNSTAAWQVFGLVARWLFSLGFWWMLALTWPRHTNKTVWAALLFAVYPGFTQQWISVIYGQAFILFAAVFFSLAITLWLARNREHLKAGWLIAGTLLSLALSAFCMFSTEYFFGLELLRPVLLWLVLKESPLRWRELWSKETRRKLFQAARWWAPYLALMIAFVIWRGFIHVFPGHDLTTISGIETNPLHSITDLIKTIIEDWIEASLVSWGQTLQLGGFLESSGNAGLRLLALILISGWLTWYYLFRLCESNLGKALADQNQHAEANDSGSEKWGLEAVLVAFFILLVAGWPFWITGIPMRMGFPLDRYTLPLAVGVCILIAGLIDLLGRSLGVKLVLLSVIVALAVGFQYKTAEGYHQEWGDVRDMFWQLTWRAPSVKPGTMFLSDSLPLQYYEDDSLSAPLNWTYDPNSHSTQMPYILFDLPTRRNSLQKFQPGILVEKDFRATLFKGSTSQVIALDYAPPGCLHVLDSVYDAESLRLSNRMLTALPLSHPGKLIQKTDTPAVPPSVLGSEPKRRWCYYYEKAELARQNEDWQTVVELSREAISQGYRPADPTENLPFIEGFLRIGMFDDAFQLTNTTMRDAPASRLALCSVWKRSAYMLNPQFGERGPQLLQQINTSLVCPAQ